MIFINLKTYPKGTGEAAKSLVIEAEKMHNELNVPLTILAQAVDIRLLCQNTKLPVWSQHIDNIESGKNTGFTLPTAIMEAGAKGSMINHSEHMLGLPEIRNIISKFQKPEFEILLSTRTPEYVQQLDAENPSYISFEPSMYIGMKSSIIDISPLLIKSLAQKIKSPFILGAGIHRADHITKGFELGGKGFIISSDILLSDTPMDRLREYMIAYKAAFGIA